MSCPHNDHTHGLLWFYLIIVAFQACAPSQCSDDFRKLARRVSDLEARCK